jgi:hypothetical protein
VSEILISEELVRQVFNEPGLAFPTDSKTSGASAFNLLLEAVRKANISSNIFKLVGSSRKFSLNFNDKKIERAL